MKKVLTYSQSIENGVVKYLPKVESVTTYKDMQKIVGGPIERIPVPMKINGNVYDIYVNEDGKNEDKLNPSIALLKYDVVDFTVGTFFLTKEDEDGELVSLTPKEIHLIEKYVEANSKETCLYESQENKTVILTISY